MNSARFAKYIGTITLFATQSLLLTPTVLGWSWSSDVQGRQIERIKRTVARNPDVERLRSQFSLLKRQLAAKLPGQMKVALSVLKVVLEDESKAPFEEENIHAIHKSMLIDVFLIEMLVEAGLEPDALSKADAILVKAALRECVRARERGFSRDSVLSRNNSSKAGKRDNKEVATQAAYEVLVIGRKLMSPYLVVYFLPSYAENHGNEEGLDD